MEESNATEQQVEQMPETKKKHHDYVKPIQPADEQQSNGYMEQEYGGAAVVVDMGIYSVAFGIAMFVFGILAIWRGHKMKSSQK